MTGGSFSLTGGFWSLVEVIQTPGAPPLRIYNTNGLITVAWAKPAEGWLLQTTNVLPDVEIENAELRQRLEKVERLLGPLRFRP